MRFSERNRRRSESPQGFNHRLDSWSLSDWMTATTGELGEAANVVKKLNRVRDGIPGNAETPNELRDQLADELADVAIYLDLMAQAAGFDMETIREVKFARTSRKIGYAEREGAMNETLEQRALRIAGDLESRDLEAAEVLRALACREPGPATLEMLHLARAIVASAVTTARVKAACAAFIAEHEPTTPAPRVRGDSRTDDAGRWSGLESGVDT